MQPQGSVRLAEAAKHQRSDLYVGLNANCLLGSRDGIVDAADGRIVCTKKGKRRTKVRRLLAPGGGQRGAAGGKSGVASYCE